MLRRTLILLFLTLWSLTSLGEITVQANLHGRSEQIELRFPQEIAVLMKRIEVWETILAAAGVEASFQVGAGELRRAALHQQESGPGDVELFLDLPKSHLRPLRNDEAFKLLRAHGIDIQKEIVQIFKA